MKTRVQIAPMMDWTDRHCRYFMRLISPSVTLYTEMITAAALQYGDTKRLLKYDQIEHPLVLQLGGSDPENMAAAAVLGQKAGYDEININVGCPSDRVKSGEFGACLMAMPHKVARCVASMKSAVNLPVTIKSRIGIDDQDSYEFLQEFVEITANSGCDAFIVHARKALLSGLSPKQNRTVPPLDYERVYRLKNDFSALDICVNGGIVSVEQCNAHLQQVDGVMIGRRAYQDPWFLTELESMLGGNPPDSRREVVDRLIPYIEHELAGGAELKHIVRHILGLYAGQPGARAWRRLLSEQAHRRGAGIEVVKAALAALPTAA